jgi:hypothetical protein
VAHPIIIRRIDGFQSYLLLDPEKPQELLRHPGFQEEFSVRPWLGSLDPMDAKEEWCEMLAEDLDNYSIADEEHPDFRLERSSWDGIKWVGEKD